MKRFVDADENETLLALIASLDARDAYRRTPTSRYNQVEFIKNLLKHFNLDSTLKQQICNAVLIHDIGMIGIPDEILLKPSQLTKDERYVIENAPQIATKILSIVPSLAIERNMILHQNENWNGSGYPDRLRGSKIPIGSRFISIARAIDAMTHDRAYRRAHPISYCLQELQINAGIQFDPTIAKTAATLLCKGND